MAPLPGNNTAVLYVDYSTCGHDHTLQCRYDDTASAGDAMALVDAFLTALDPGLTQTDIIGARVRDQGGSVTYPVTWTGAAQYGGTAGPAYKSAAYLDFVGRSIDGRRARIAVFGPGDFFDATNEDYRFTTADSAVIAAAVAVLEGGIGTPCSISGEAVNWHQYANTGVNAYWRNHIR